MCTLDYEYTNYITNDTYVFTKNSLLNSIEELEESDWDYGEPDKNWMNLCYSKIKKAKIPAGLVSTCHTVEKQEFYSHTLKKYFMKSILSQLL